MITLNWTQSFIINRYKNPMIYKLLMIICLFMGQNSYGAASGETEDKESSKPRVVVKEKKEKPLMSVEGLKERNDKKRPLHRAYPEQGLIEYRDHFVERVKSWEEEMRRPMEMPDLLAPYLEDVGEEKKKLKLCTIFKNAAFKTSKDIPAAQRLFWSTVEKARQGWHNAGNSFLASTRYDSLFSFEMFIENYRLGAVIFPDFIPCLHFKHHDLLNSIEKPTKEEETRAHYLYGLRRTRLYSYHVAPGMITDTPSEGIQGTLGRPLIWMEVIRPPFDPPTTSPDANLRYLHEVEGKGFSVFLHLFKGMREEVAPFTAYGMKKDYRVPPFIQTGYRLPPSMILEEEGEVVELGDASGAATGGAATGGASDREGLRYRGKGSASGAGESAGIGLREEKSVVLAKASSLGSSAAAKAEGSMEAVAASRPASPVDEEENKPLLASAEGGK